MRSYLLIARRVSFSVSRAGSVSGHRRNLLLLSICVADIYGNYLWIQEDTIILFSIMDKILIRDDYFIVNVTSDEVTSRR